MLEYRSTTLAGIKLTKNTTGQIYTYISTIILQKLDILSTNLSEYFHIFSLILKCVAHLVKSRATVEKGGIIYQVIMAIYFAKFRNMFIL